MTTAQTLAAPTEQPSVVTAGASPAGPGLLLPSLSLAKRELVRFLRQRHRIIGALATPIVFWLLIGGGDGAQLPSADGAGRRRITCSISSPARADDPAVHGDLLDDLDHRGPPRRISASRCSSRRCRGWRSCWAKCSAGRCWRSGRACCSCCSRRSVGIHLTLAALLRGADRHADRFVRADGAGLLHRLADELDAGLSRDHEPVPDADVVPVRRAVSRRGRAGAGCSG